MLINYYTCIELKYYEVPFNFFASPYLDSTTFRA